MLRSILSQLSQQCVQISPSLEALVASSAANQQLPRSETLLKYLQNVLQDFPHTYIVLDALDECGDRKHVMSIIRSLSESRIEGLHLLCTSRRDGDLETNFSRFLEKSQIQPIQRETVDLDIKSYIHERLSNEVGLQKWRKDEAIRGNIETVLMQGAQGM